jgi:4-hydroxy 2-oxovalerate aldolase
MDKAIWLAEHCMDKGYEVTINLMAISTVMMRDLEEALTDVAKSRVPVLYLVDSFGSMYCEQIELLVNKYREYLPDRTIGVHMHNNMQLAFSNTVTGIIHHCNMLDATILGLGRGAGNCPLELLMSFLKNPKFDLRPILDVIQRHFLPLQKEIEWGYHIPYLITGANNYHPRSAMKWMSSENKNDYVAFFNQVMDQKDL